MKIAIMQPYFFPYIGYFQLITAVDLFVVYDDIKYTKKGWINRNRILVNGNESLISLPLKKDSDYLNINERYLSNDYSQEAQKILRKIKESYSKAPFFNTVYPILSECILYEEKNLFKFIYYSLMRILNYLNIKTKILISSELGIKEQLKRESRVIGICKNLNASHYINAIGGVTLYSKEEFSNENITLNFIKSKNIEYKQFENQFIPWLSILDVMMFNSLEKLKDLINEYQLI